MSGVTSDTSLNGTLKDYTGVNATSENGGGYAGNVWFRSDTMKASGSIDIPRSSSNQNITFTFSTTTSNSKTTTVQWQLTIPAKERYLYIATTTTALSPIKLSFNSGGTWKEASLGIKGSSGWITGRYYT